MIHGNITILICVNYKFLAEHEFYFSDYMYNNDRYIEDEDSNDDGDDVEIP